MVYTLLSGSPYLWPFYLSLILEIYYYVTANSGHYTGKTKASLDTACAVSVQVRCKASKTAAGL